MAFWHKQAKRMTSERIIQAAETLAGTPLDQQIKAVKENGFSEGEAHRLVALLPLAFSRPMLEELGIKHFVPVVTAVARDGTPIEAMLMRQPEYAIGLRVARNHRRKSILELDVYNSVAGGSSDTHAVSNALNAGASVVGATIASSLVGPDIAEHLIR
ncbi:hypothetical protein [Novosphingobium sp.]|uniref:hypothetical protein n=1 Tax=Novosphingobium sp. TaxID=1874826 RepID=UPI003D108791